MCECIGVVTRLTWPEGLSVSVLRVGGGGLSGRGTGSA